MSPVAARRELPLALSQHDVPLSGLDPRHDGLRIAHLSDIHCGNVTPAEHVRRAVAITNQARPDLVLMTGDFVNWRRSDIDLMEEQLAGLRANRVIAVLGNHDHYAGARGVSNALARMGYDVLDNANTSVDVGGAPLCVVGVDDPVTRNDDPDRAFEGAGPGTRIALCHDPRRAKAMAMRGAALTLSGHTHGGQVNPGGITVRLAQRLRMRYMRGFYDVVDAKLYVTSGVGFTFVAWRTGEGTDAEVALLTLRR
jgi:hypothetical protein